MSWWTAPREVERLRRELAELRTAYDCRMQDLANAHEKAARLRASQLVVYLVDAGALEGYRVSPFTSPRAADKLEELLRAAGVELRQAVEPPAKVTGYESASGATAAYHPPLDADSIRRGMGQAENLVRERERDSRGTCAQCGRWFYDCWCLANG